jgi:radical SAM protein with 4Fe4S-binding SPASM domain
VAQIRQAGLNNVGISVDGMRANHNRIRGVKDSFEHAQAAMAKLRAAKIPIAVVTSLLDFNVDDLEPLYDWLVAQGVNVWQIQIATGMGNMAAQTVHCLNPAKVPRVTRFIRQKRLPQEIRIYAGDDIGYYDEHELYLRNRPGTIAAWQGCQAGLRVVGIDSVGHVKGCESLYDDRFIEGNVRDEPLTKIWRKKGNFAYNREFTVRQLTGACAACDQAERCRGGCRGACYFTANAMFENPYCCYPGKPKNVTAARLRRPAERRARS